MGFVSFQHLPLLKSFFRRPTLVFGSHVFPAVFGFDKSLGASDTRPGSKGHLEVSPQHVFSEVGSGGKPSVAAGAGVLGPPARTAD